MPEVKITIIRSGRKTLSIQLKHDEIIARAPLRMKDKEIYSFIESKKSWIEKHLASLAERQKALEKIQPFTEEEIIVKLEENLKNVRPLTALMDEGIDIEDIVRDVLKGFDVEVIYTEEVAYKCKCSREKVEATLKSINKEELAEMTADLPEVSVCCDFCNTTYSFSKKDIEKILKN